MPGPVSVTVISASGAVDGHGRADPGAGRGVRTGVGQQVGHHLVQAVAVAERDDRLGRQVELPDVVRAGGPRVAERR